MGINSGHSGRAHTTYAPPTLTMTSRQIKASKRKLPPAATYTLGTIKFQKHPECFSADL